MKKGKIIIAVHLDAATQRPFEYLKEMPIVLDAEIQLVHMVPVTFHGVEMGFEIEAYPPKVDRPKIETEIKKKLAAFKEEFFPNHTNVSSRVIFDTNVKAAFSEYVEKEKADLVVVATRGRHGIKTFFDSSFAQHQLKYSVAHVLVLR